MKGGQGGTGRPDCSGREEPAVGRRPGAAEDWADAVSGSRTRRPVSGPAAELRPALPAGPPS